MKKYLSLFMLVGLLFSPFAYAEEGKGTGGLERMPPVFNPDLKPKLTEEQKAKRDAFLEEIKARKESWREANKERKAAFCEQANKVFGQRFGSSIGALEMLQARVGSVLSKLTGEGKDTKASNELLGKSKEKSNLAKSKLEEVKKLLPGTCEKLSPEIYEKVKLGLREVKDLLKESRDYLHETIKSMKELREKPESSEASS